MNLKTVGTFKGILSAALLSCLMVASVVITQPEKADKVTPASSRQQPQGSIQPRNYETRLMVSNRGDKPPQSSQDSQDSQTSQISQTLQASLASQTSQDSQTSQASKPVKPTSDFTYAVKSGDTLSELALTYGVTVENIIAANGLDSDKLSLDQKLLIPASGKVKALKPAVAKAPKAANKTQKTVTTASTARYSGRPVGELIKWSEARNIFGIGSVATAIDVNTGYTFKIKRKGGHNHADCEPLTAADTAIMKKVYGSWSWDRRAVVIEVKGRKIAASMAGMPHGSDDISGNGFAGHFDVHFLGSMTHGSEYTKSRVPIVDPDHQAMVRKAAGL